jgi:hypothetical protein
MYCYYYHMMYEERTVDRFLRNIMDTIEADISQFS